MDTDDDYQDIPMAIDDDNQSTSMDMDDDNLETENQSMAMGIDGTHTLQVS